MAQKRDFVYKVNTNWVFTINSYKNSYKLFKWLKSISIGIIMAQIMFATNLAKKNNKNKKSKNKEKHKKYIRNKENNKKQRKLILIPDFFLCRIVSNVIGNIHTKNQHSRSFI